jgi:hypothetical protein
MEEGVKPAADGETPAEAWEEKGPASLLKRKRPFGKIALITSLIVVVVVGVVFLLTWEGSQGPSNPTGPTPLNPPTDPGKTNPTPENPDQAMVARDAGVATEVPVDAGSTAAGPADAGSVTAAQVDAGPPDAGSAVVAQADAGTPQTPTNKHPNKNPIPPVNPNLKPVVKVDPKLVTPPPPGAVGTLKINSEPFANVYLGAKLLGPTPQMDIKLPVGSHTLTLKNDALGITRKVRVKIEAGKVHTVFVDLNEKK